MLSSCTGERMKVSRHISRFKRSESGVAVFEFVMVMPMTILLFAVLMDFGRIYWGVQSITAGVRDATRYLARVAPVDICITGGSLSGYETTLEGFIENDIRAASVLPGGFTLTDISADYTCITGTFRTSPAAVATVTADVDIDFMLGNWFGVVADELGSFSTSISDASRVFGQ